MSLTIINTAGIYREKNPEEWVEIATTVIPDDGALQARWYGNVGNAYREFVRRAEADSLGRIRFPGSIDPAEVLKMHKAGQVVLLVSSEIEVFPLSVMEAARAGTPIVCRRFPGHEEVFGDYPLLFETRTEAVAALRLVRSDWKAAQNLSRRLFETQFMKTAEWYATVDRMAASIGIVRDA